MSDEERRGGGRSKGELGFCGTEWEYLRDQITCSKCQRMPNMNALRNIPKQRVVYTPPTYCDDCHALKEFWSQCTDCKRSSKD